MPTYYLAPDPCQSTFFIPGGNQPGNGVKVFTYATGTTTKVSVAKDAAGAALHTNPIILDSGGNLPTASSMYIEAGVTIDVVYAPSGDSDPPTSAYKTVSTVRGVPPQNTSTSQWVSVASPVFVNTNAFRVEGDQTTELHVGRRIRTTNTGGTVYSRVTSTAFGTSTTVGVVNDSGAIDSGISTAAYGLLSSDNNSVPLLTDFYPTLRSSTAIHTQSQNIQAYTSSHTVTWPDQDVSISTASSGTWTPFISYATSTDAANTYTEQRGWYSKIDNLVVAGFAIDPGTFGTNSGSAFIAGLPFASGTSTRSAPALYALMGNTTAASVYGILNTNTTSIRLLMTNLSGAQGIIDHDGAGDDTSLYGSISYNVD